MAPSGTGSRKAPSASRVGKVAAATAGVIRVAVPVHPIVPPVSQAPVTPQSAPPPLAPGMPCSGRCGQCGEHPCRLHAQV